MNVKALFLAGGLGTRLRPLPMIAQANGAHYGKATVGKNIES